MKTERAVQARARARTHDARSCVTRARTHARMHARPRRHSMLAAVSHDSFCGKKKETSGGEREAFISSAREEQKTGHLEQRASPLHNFVSHRACT